MLKNKMKSWGLRWLNLAGKLVLIKSILVSYAICTSAIFLTPKSTINGIIIVTNKFLWRGEKTQGKKFHLVNWDKNLEDKKWWAWVLFKISIEVSDRERSGSYR